MVRSYLSSDNIAGARYSILEFVVLNSVYELKKRVPVVHESWNLSAPQIIIKESERLQKAIT